MIYKNNKLVVNLLHGNTIIDKVYKNNLVVYQKNKTDELPNYFKLTALEPGTIKMSKSNKEIYWSTNGKSWTLSPTSESTISVEATTGTNLYLRGNWLDLRYELGNGPLIGTTCKYDISGNIFSLIYNEDFEDKTVFPTDQTSFDYFFSGDLNLINAKDLILPATTLNDYCYYCMFQNCTSLTAAPELPATTLTEGCYEQMFNGCTSLTTAPELPATTLVNYCYHYMFNDCTNLNYIKAMFTTEPVSRLNYTTMWVYGVSPTGTFVKNSAATWNVTGASGIPRGWTVELANS